MQSAAVSVLVEAGRGDSFGAVDEVRRDHEHRQQRRGPGGALHVWFHFFGPLAFVLRSLIWIWNSFVSVCVGVISRLAHFT